MEKIADLPMLNDIDADYTPQYVKLARILRGKIDSGHYQHGDDLPASELTAAYEVSPRVAWHALRMLAANRYVHRRPGRFGCYSVTWKAAYLWPGAVPGAGDGAGKIPPTRTRGADSARRSGRRPGPVRHAGQG